MRHLSFIFLVILLATPFAFSQVNTTLYFNEHNQLTTHDKATIRREAAMDMS